MKKKIFFSYSRIDGAAFAIRLALELKKEGFNVWIDQQDIRAGTEWDLEVEKALETCDCLLFIETAASISSNNVLDEVYYALENKKKVIPLILVDSKTPFRLQRLQHIDFSKNYAVGFTRLLNELENKQPALLVFPFENDWLAKKELPVVTKSRSILLAAAFLLVIVVASVLYTSLNKNEPVVKSSGGQVPDSAANELQGNNNLPEQPFKNPVITTNDAKPPTLLPDKKQTVLPQKRKEPKNNYIEQSTELNETLAGNWQLMGVEPTARLMSGYLKITSDEIQKISIKSHVQFYYFKGKENSYPAVFNAFANCTSCTPATNIKITAEDIAIGSQTIKTDSNGDTILNAGFNKSIRGTITLRFVDKKTAIIKVRRTEPAALGYGLTMAPFEYSFRFKKED